MASSSGALDAAPAKCNGIRLDIALRDGRSKANCKRRSISGAAGSVRERIDDMTAEERLAALGLSLPAAPAPAAKYVPAVISGKMLFTSGQLPLQGGKLTSIGLVGRDVSIEQGQEAAKWCALNALAQANAAAGSLEAIKRLVKISVFVASTPDFTQQHIVANGGSELFVAVLGDHVGPHARSAVGMASLPLNAPVEIEAIFELK
jgi:enamine deaminase RidA (YjgF/YER057c/UK114 family)